jgi:hypothetical protein
MMQWVVDKKKKAITALIHCCYSSIEEVELSF